MMYKSIRELQEVEDRLRYAVGELEDHRRSLSETIDDLAERRSALYDEVRSEEEEVTRIHRAKLQQLQADFRREDQRLHREHQVEVEEATQQHVDNMKRLRAQYAQEHSAHVNQMSAQVAQHDADIYHQIHQFREDANQNMALLGQVYNEQTATAQAMLEGAHAATAAIVNELDEVMGMSSAVMNHGVAAAQGFLRSTEQLMAHSVRQMFRLGHQPVAPLCGGVQDQIGDERKSWKMLMSANQGAGFEYGYKSMVEDEDEEKKFGSTVYHSPDGTVGANLIDGLTNAATGAAQILIAADVDQVVVGAAPRPGAARSAVLHWEPPVFVDKDTGAQTENTSPNLKLPPPIPPVMYLVPNRTTGGMEHDLPINPGVPVHMVGVYELVGYVPLVTLIEPPHSA